MGLDVERPDQDKEYFRQGRPMFTHPRYKSPLLPSLDRALNPINPTYLSVAWYPIRPIGSVRLDPVGWEPTRRIAPRKPPPSPPFAPKTTMADPVVWRHVEGRKRAVPASRHTTREKEPIQFQSAGDDDELPE